MIDFLRSSAEDGDMRTHNFRATLIPPKLALLDLYLLIFCLTGVSSMIILQPFPVSEAFVSREITFELNLVIVKIRIRRPSMLLIDSFQAVVAKLREGTVFT
jgi:hypothetical protein